MTLSEIQDYTTHASQVATLGSIVWSTVSSTNVAYSEVKARLDAVGLPAALPTSPPADVDVFRRAFFNGQRRKRSAGPDMTEHLLIRQVSASSDRIVKRIVVEEVDAKGARLSYSEAVEIVFDTKNPGKVQVWEIGHEDETVQAEIAATLAPRVTLDPKIQRMMDELRGIRASLAPEAPSPIEAPVAPVAPVAPHGNVQAVQLAADLRAEYLRERGCLDANGIRYIITRVLNACQATAVREGGAVYFVSNKYDKELAALEQLASQLPGVSLHTLPLLDDQKQRDMVREAFINEAVTVADKTIAEVAEILRSGNTISPWKFVALNKSYQEITAKSNEYQEILRENLDNSVLRLDILGKQIGVAIGRVAS